MEKDKWLKYTNEYERHIPKLKLIELQRIAERLGGKCLSKIYVNTKIKLNFQCKEGHIWSASPKNIKKGKWCKKCAHKASALRQKLKFGIKELQEIAKKKGGRIRSTKYINAHTKVELECEEGHIWKATPTNIKTGKWCRKCSYKQRALKKQLRNGLEELKIIAKMHGGDCLSTKYVNNRTKLTFCCELGHVWKATPSNIKKGKWCKECGYKTSSSKLRLKNGLRELQEIANKRGGKCLATKYTNNRLKLPFSCKNGHFWEASPTHIKRGRWCPKCKMGRGERICRSLFEVIFKMKFPRSHPKWLKNDRGNQMELDGYNKELALAFEYQGEQHYQYNTLFYESVCDFEQRKLDDSLKRELCNQYDVVLIEIPHIIRYEEMYNFIIEKCKEEKVNIPESKANFNLNDLINKAYVWTDKSIKHHQQTL
ncbi:MAG: hypothetical protein HWN65_04830 [Candidatus Helarchaeota archaeon]|nr:hypothetical protein [Candidatus Helarchaeota archaeon]